MRQIKKKSFKEANLQNSFRNLINKISSEDKLSIFFKEAIFQNCFTKEINIISSGNKLTIFFKETKFQNSFRKEINKISLGNKLTRFLFFRKSVEYLNVNRLYVEII